LLARLHPSFSFLCAITTTGALSLTLHSRTLHLNKEENGGGSRTVRRLATVVSHVLGRQPIHPEDRIVADLVDLCAEAGRQRLAVLQPEHGHGFVALHDRAEEGDPLVDREGLVGVTGLLQLGRDCKGKDQSTSEACIIQNIIRKSYGVRSFGPGLKPRGLDAMSRVRRFRLYIFFASK